MSSAQHYLEQQLLLAAKAEGWLQHSVQQCQSRHGQPYSKADYDALEALCSRYGRFVDILINKLFRALDQFELMESGTLIDTIHRAEKRGLIDMDTARELKELRNRIVHEYDPDEIGKMALDIIDYAQVALDIYAQLQQYLMDRHGISPDG